MNEGPTVRVAGTRDLSAFLGLVDELADYEKLERPTPEARARLERDGFGAEPVFTPFVAELGGEIVGYAIVFYTYSSFLARPTLYLEDVFVRPESRGAGVGHAIFRHLAAEAVRRDCGRMEWVVLDWNRLAIDFYDRLGAQALDGWTTYRLDRERLESMAAESA
jgi:GNAT superfamily N-acetyltransferase